MAQLVERLTPDFGLGHDLTVHVFLMVRQLCTDGVEPAWDSLSLPFSLPLPCSCALSLSLSQNK